MHRTKFSIESSVTIIIICIKIIFINYENYIHSNYKDSVVCCDNVFGSSMNAKSFKSKDQSARFFPICRIGLQN